LEPAQADSLWNDWGIEQALDLASAGDDAELPDSAFQRRFKLTFVGYEA
jgi:hypothetical protein